MRRQARLSAGGALVVRSASSLQVWLWLLIFIFQNEVRGVRSIQPGYLDFDNLPDTNFTCAGKVIGGYYADLETSCQMFHVCTVGTENETMDIKFLCLNGTVFDQETRVCERVDEVDCTKSEKFYSLNLELYGSAAPPIIQPEQVRPHTTSTTTEHPHPPTEPHVKEETDPTVDDFSTTTHDKVQHSTETIDSTEDPVQEKKNDPHNLHTIQTAEQKPDNEEEEELDSEIPEYEDDYSHNIPSTTTTQAPTTTSRPITTTSTTTRQPTSTTTRKPITIITSPAPPSSLPPSVISSSIASPSSTLDPSALSPEEFTHRHRGPGSEAISFQRQGFRPADGIYITHAPPLQFDHFQYESSRTAPRPVAPRPTPFANRSQPQPFRATTPDPRDQMLRPVATSQTVERHQRVPAPRTDEPLPYDSFYYDNKRNDDSIADTALQNESFLTARSVAPPTRTEHRFFKPKSPPRVIVTASASVSDSNGRRLNYTVGNVVSEVKPIAQVNYDDYKETDFDPFFLDVPKLQKRRKSRSIKNGNTVFVPLTTTKRNFELNGKVATPMIKPPMHRTEYSVDDAVIITESQIQDHKQLPYKPKTLPQTIISRSSSENHSRVMWPNHTVSNVISTVKQSAQTNHGSQGETIFNPVSTEVPNVQSRHMYRSNKNQRIFGTTPSAVSSDFSSTQTTVTVSSPITSRATTTERKPTTPTTTTRACTETNTSVLTTEFENPSTIEDTGYLFLPCTTTAAWNPNDYVDDNYEPHAYMPPAHPLALLVPHSRNMYEERRPQLNVIAANYSREQVNTGEEQVRPITSAVQTTSSQGVASSPTPADVPLRHVTPL